MTEQEKREKVIKGLEELRVHFRAMAEISSSKQGRANHIESATIIGDAITLLEAEKPRPDCAGANHDAGWCLGYCHAENDDEPIDICKTCDLYTGNAQREATPLIS